MLSDPNVGAEKMEVSKFNGDLSQADSRKFSDKVGSFISNTVVDYQKK